MTNDQLSGGSSITPPLNAFIDNYVLEKRVLIDWLSISFDFITVHHMGYNAYLLDYYNPDLRKLVTFFNFPEENPLTSLQKTKPLNGYSESILLGENITLNFGGEHTKNAQEKYSINLNITGQGCREFEKYMNGQWHELLKFFLDRKSTIKRIDIAIDDFQANEIDIYDILPYITKGHYVSPMRKVNIQQTYDKAPGTKDMISLGYAITFGSKGSNQLQIYDKNAERKVKNEETSESQIWYRYEMRFVDEKAKSVSEMYITAVETNDSTEFMKLAHSLLYNMLDIKIYNPNDYTISRWKTLPSWVNFLDSVQKIKLNAKKKEESTMIKKKLWYERSVSSTELLLLNYLGFNGLKKMQFESMRDALDRFDEKKLTVLNNGLKNLGKEPMTMSDVKNMREAFNLWLGDIEEDEVIRND